jgi:putative transposase
VRDWLERLGVKTAHIEPGSPWENGCVRSFIGKLRDELLNGEIFDTLLEAKVLTERRHREYNHVRPHRALDRMTSSKYAEATARNQELPTPISSTA